MATKRKKHRSLSRDEIARRAASGDPSARLILKYALNARAIKQRSV